ncbi:MAG: 50S ribosomal protein L29 [Actinobacteria bacterium]|nr:MAG: 50S ribosomal protein L29 [Actinomycetota bacterium]
MKAKEVHELEDSELQHRLSEAKAELFNLRFQHATGQLDNPLKIREAKRNIARIQTVLRERELAVERQTPVVAARGRRR